jgi:hypothetical protein
MLLHECGYVFVSTNKNGGLSVKQTFLLINSQYVTNRDGIHINYNASKKFLLNKTGSDLT